MKLVVDKEVIQTESGPKEMIRLASIDMGQANAKDLYADINPPFYIGF